MDASDRENGLFDFSLPVVDMTQALAYVRPVRTEKGIGYGVFAADGTQLAVFGSRDAAYFAAKQQDLEPVHIH